MSTIVAAGNATVYFNLLHGMGDENNPFSICFSSLFQLALVILIYVNILLSTIFIFHLAKTMSFTFENGHVVESFDQLSEHLPQNKSGVSFRLKLAQGSLTTYFI